MSAFDYVEVKRKTDRVMAFGVFLCELSSSDDGKKKKEYDERRVIARRKRGGTQRRCK